MERQRAARPLAKTSPVRQEQLEVQDVWRIALPRNLEAERLAIGAVLIANAGVAKRFVALAKGEHFFDPARGWLWERMKYGLERARTEDVCRWLFEDGNARRCRALWQTSLLGLVNEGLDETYWWHGRYYVGLILEEHRKRTKIVEAVRNLQRTIET